MNKTCALKALVAGAVLSGVAAAQPFGGGGMVPGMVGAYGMGPGMMRGDGNETGAGLELGASQRRRIAAIQQEASKAIWRLMGTLHEQGHHMQGIFGLGALDESAARKAFQIMQETQKAIFETQLEARRKIDAVLTKEERDLLRG